ncbi:hypothetical protein D3C77_241810 [compost metagenome]
MNFHLPAESLQYLVLCLGGHQQEVAHLTGLQMVEIVCSRAAGIGDLRADEVQLHNAGENCLGRDNAGVLAEHHGGAEGRGIGVVATVLYPGQT